MNSFTARLAGGSIRLGLPTMRQYTVAAVIMVESTHSARLLNPRWAKFTLFPPQHFVAHVEGCVANRNGIGGFGVQRQPESKFFLKASGPVRVRRLPYFPITTRA